MEFKESSIQHTTLFLVLRRLRKTLIGLIVIYAVAVLGLTLAPGLPGDDGLPTRIDFFHAFYFISYTATTIGFGELPTAFSEQQRLWVTFCIYLTVTGWAVFIGALLAMYQDANLQRAIHRNRFARAVAKLSEPFYLVCGYGETGRLICSALDHLSYRAVVLELDESLLADIELKSYRADIPALAGDAASPHILHLAGLTHPHCLGVVVLTTNDTSNLAVSIAGHLLAPTLPVLARAETEDTAASMASFGIRHIINPFSKFGDYLAQAMHCPARYHLLMWLTGLPDTILTRHRDPPHGHWLLCGFGNFGRSLSDAIRQEGLPVTIIDQHPEPTDHPGMRWIQGDGTTAETLRQGGIEDAVGIIAATSSDVINLSFAVTARQINPDAFVIVRQNKASNAPLYAAFGADITMVPSEIIAQECMAILTTPLLAPFLDAVHRAEEDWCENLLKALTDNFGWNAPEVWSITLEDSSAQAVVAWLQTGQHIKLGDILRHPAQRHETLRCKVLQLQRQTGDSLILPANDTALNPGDQLLLTGFHQARRELDFTLNNEHSLHYVLTGREMAGGWLWKWLAARQAAVGWGKG